MRKRADRGKSGQQALLPTASKVDIAATLTRANQLHDRGALDESAVAFDLALEAVWATPHLRIDKNLLIESFVTRASLALARREEKRARAVLDRLLTFSPTLVLRADEARPSLQQVLSQLRAEPEARAKIPSTLASATCRTADILLVARLLTSTKLQVARFDQCRPVATVVTAVSSPPQQVVAQLLVNDAKPEENKRTPLYKRTWFWIGAGALISGGVAAALFIPRGDDSALEVVPVFSDAYDDTVHVQIRAAIHPCSVARLARVAQSLGNTVDHGANGLVDGLRASAPFRHRTFLF